MPGTSLQEEEQLSYNISRHFKAIGKKEKLRASNGSATALVQVASYFNSISRYEEAKLYSRAAMALSAKNSVLFALASAQLFYALAGLQQNPAYGGIEEPETTVLKLYQQALLVSNWHWGPDNLISMTFHDRMSMIAHKLKNAKKAAEYHKLSLDVAIKALGNNHSVTASYLTRVYFANISTDAIYLTWGDWKILSVNLRKLPKFLLALNLARH